MLKLIFAIVLMVISITLLIKYSILYFKRNRAVYDFRTNILNKCRDKNDLVEYKKLPSYFVMFFQFWKPVESFLDE